MDFHKIVLEIKLVKSNLSETHRASLFLYPNWCLRSIIKAIRSHNQAKYLNSLRNFSSV